MLTLIYSHPAPAIPIPFQSPQVRNARALVARVPDPVAVAPPLGGSAPSAFPSPSPLSSIHFTARWLNSSRRPSPQRSADPAAVTARRHGRCPVKPFFLLDELTHHLQRSSTDPVPPQGTPPLLSRHRRRIWSSPTSCCQIRSPTTKLQLHPRSWWMLHQHLQPRRRKLPLHLLPRRKKLPRRRRPKPPS